MASVRRVGVIVGGVLVVLVVQNAARGGVWSAGHGDLGPEIVKGIDGGPNEVHLHLHLHSGATVDGSPLDADEEFELSGVRVLVPKIPDATYYSSYGSSDTLWLVGEDKASVPSQSVQRRLGLAAGEFFWNLPDDGELGGDYPFLGYGYHEEGWGNRDLKAKLTLLDFSGPDGGEFVLWRSGPQRVHMQTSDGIDENVDFLEFTADHGHANWSFSKAGDYALTIRSDAYVLNGPNWDWIGSDEGTLQFQVVPEPSSLVLAGIGVAGVISVCARRRRCVSRSTGAPS